MVMHKTLSDPGAALVTGGAGGIGWAICQRLARVGYRLVIADLNADEARRRAASLGPDHAALGVDLTDAKAARDLLHHAAGMFGPLRVVVNNAGMTDTGGHALTVMPLEAFERIIALNLTAVEEICTQAAQVLLPGGVVVNIASGAAWRPLPLRGPYSATKSALVALTEGLATEYAALGLRIGGVAPGYTVTPLVEELSRAGRLDLDAVAATIPLGRLAMPQDIADAVAFMVSDAGAALAGQTLSVDGGVSQGQAPQGDAPGCGTAEGAGALAWLGTSSDVAGVAVTTAQALDAIRPLGAVVDATALAEATPAEVLARARETARACAAHPDRSRDFALVFVAPTGDTPAKRAAQAGQAMLARTLALEWAHAGLRVNAVEWRGGGCADMVALCRFLTSAEARYITGQAIIAGHLPGHTGALN